MGWYAGISFWAALTLDISWPPRNRYQAAICMAPEKGKRVLDIGCGNGTVLYNLWDTQCKHYLIKRKIEL